MVLPIDYSDLITLFMFIFAVVGILRGWYREAITSIFTAALALLLWRQEIALKIIDYINKLIKLVIMFINSGFSADPGKLTSQAVPADVIDPYSYQLYIVVTVVLLTVSYIVGETTFHDRQTPLGRLLGGLLGAFNGWIILSLVKQYLINHLTRGQVGAQANQLSLQVTQVPTGDFLAGAGIIFILVVVVGVVALLIAGDRMRLPLR